MSRRPELSVVTTLYHSAPYIDEFHRRMTAEARQVTENYEIIYVNDASPDNSIDLALKLQEQDPHVKVIDLAANYQHLKALMTGLDYASGDLVFLIDIDLEEDPELLGSFHQRLIDEDVDVVYGVQERRKGGWWERVSGSVFYKVINFFSDVEIPRNLITARLMRRRYVRALVSHREREVYLGGILAITGFRQVPEPVTKGNHSPSTYSLRLKVRDAVNGVLSFSNKPLIYVFYTGAAIMALTLPVLAYLIAGHLFFSRRLQGWTSTIVSVWFLGGLVIFMVGIIGVYLAKVFVETKQRPYTLIRELYGFEDDRPDPAPRNDRYQGRISE